MFTINDVARLSFKPKGDERGRLVVVESEHDIPFIVKRVFYIYGSTPDVVRGQHANRRSSFVLINVSGTSKVKCIDCFGNEMLVELNKPHIGLYIPPMIWKDMYDFSADSVLLVLSDEHYDANEYIRDFDQFRGLGK
jgi:dTDP-4-dehydrorhamnose 3,5-epimerase-like enzyme